MRALLRSISSLPLALGVCVTAAAQSPAAPGAPDHAELARRIVETSAAIKPGEVVVVAGGRHTIPLMEAVAIEAMKAGGKVEMLLQTDAVARAAYAEVPEQFLEQEPRFWGEWFKHIDVWIGLPGIQDQRAAFADIPEARFAKAARATQFFAEALNQARLRGIFVGYPTPEVAAQNQLDFPVLERMHWAAVNTDYQSISRTGRELRRVLQGARSVRVTSPAGTDLTFAVDNRPVFVNDGIVTEEDTRSEFVMQRTASLPGGEIFLAPIESSGSGRVVVPRARCRFEPLTGVSFELRDGRMHGFTAGQGADCFHETLAPHGERRDVLGLFWIGLNPELRVIEDGADYRPDHAAGMVGIAVGGNDWFGGENRETGWFSFPITNATVTVDGRVVVRDGKLVL